MTPIAPSAPEPDFTAYAHPERLVSTQWLGDHLGDPGLVVAECDEDVLLYATGHIPGAVKLDWHTELNDPVWRDYLDGEGFAKLMSAKGISRDTTVVIYGDKSNWWAAYALWVMSLYGHPDVRLLDGGRAAWIAEGRELTRDKPQVTPSDYPVVERDDSMLRAYREDVLALLPRVGAGEVGLVDVRSPQEYTGERTHMADYPEEGVLRGGHIPGAVSVPWSSAVSEDGRFRSREELEAIYQEGQGLDPDQEVVAYCRIGERSSITWFVLHHLLGFSDARNYDGSWTEWGNAVRMPVATGTEPGRIDD